jgi:hypothetical protein
MKHLWMKNFNAIETNREKIKTIDNHLKTLVSRLAVKKWYFIRCSLAGIQPPRDYNGDWACLQLHHKNGNPKDNRFENLQILTANQHVSLHVRRNTKNFLYV